MGAWVLSRFSRVRPFVTQWTAAHQASLFMGFSKHSPAEPRDTYPLISLILAS